MIVVKFTNMLLSFLLEMTVFFIYGYWGYGIGSSQAGKCAMAFASFLIAGLCWAVFASPKSSTRLNYPGIVVFKFLFFLLAVLLLYLSGYQLFAGILAIIIFINISLEILFKQ